MHRQIYKLYTYTHIYIYFFFTHACKHTCTSGNLRRRTQGTTKAHVFSRWTTTAPPEELSGPWDRGVSFTDGPHRHLRLWIFAYNTPNRQAVNLAPSECGHRRHRDGVALRSPGRLPGYRFSSGELSGH